jgi:UDP-glucose 4-epimerase
MITRVALNPHEFDLYNLGSGIGYSVQEILDRVEKLLGISLKIAPAPTPQTYVHKVVLDMSRYDKEFGPRDLTSLDQGIAKTLENEREWLGVSTVKRAE